MVEVQTQVRVASGVEAIVVKAADRVEPLDSECNKPFNIFSTKKPVLLSISTKKKLCKLLEKVYATMFNMQSFR